MDERARQVRATGKRGGKKPLKRCKKQLDQCRSFFAELCPLLPFDPADCVAAFTPCCPVFADCSVAMALECVFTAASEPAPPGVIVEWTGSQSRRRRS